MIRRSIAMKIGLAIIGLVALDMTVLYLSLHQLLTRVLRSGGVGQVASARVEELLLLAAVGAVLIAIGLIVVLSQRLARPLKRMVEVTQGIAHGRYQTRVLMKGNDEVARLGEAINELARHLQRLDTTRKEFLADVAHELRTPLTYMRGYAQVLYDGMAKTPEETRHYLKIIYEETKRVERLVEDLFALAQADVSALNLHRESVDLTNLIEQVVAKFHPKAKEQNINLSVQGAIGEQCDLDPVRIEQAIVNLLDNALRYTPNGGAVTLNLMRKGDYTVIAVQDSGAGISSDELPFIWDRLYRVDKSRSREHGGAGLGLSIVKHIVELHGGRVSAESRVGHGTTMRLALPVRETTPSKKGEME